MNRNFKKIRLATVCFLASAIYLMSIRAQSQYSNTELLSPGKSIYAANCASCHGVEMEAFVDWEWKHGSSDKEIRASIITGRGKGAMPAFGEALSDQQVTDLVTYLRLGFDNLNKYDFEKEKVDPSGVFKSEDLKFKLEPVVSGLESPWGMAFPGNGEMLVTDKVGHLYLVNLDGEKQMIKNPPVVNHDGQGGLMDIELHRDYSKNGWIYLSYSFQKKEKGKKLTTTKVSRYHLKDNELIDEELIFEALPYSETRHHYGSRLEFDNDGYLFITVGDRGARNVNPQSLQVFPGKVHRVNADGSIPKDNPFYLEKNAVKSIYSYGHRNPQGLTKHPVTGKIWEHEHGPRGGDEINLVKKGANYGWPKNSYGINYNGTTFTLQTESEGMESPVHYWVPSIAPCGMDFVTSNKYPGWEGQLLVGSLRFEYLNLCKLEGNNVVSEEILMPGIGRVRNVKEGPDGFIYVAIEEPGKIFKLIPLN